MYISFIRFFAIVSLVFVLYLPGCIENDISKPDDSEISTEENEGSQSWRRPEEIEEMVSRLFLTYWSIQKTYPAPALSVAAWEYSSSWTNFGLQDMGTMPRVPYNNSPLYTYRYITYDPWYNLYTVIYSTNEVIRAIGNGEMDLLGPQRVARTLAFAKFMEGICYGFLALQFDRAFIWTGDIDVDVAAGLREYYLVMDTAIGLLEEAAQIASENSFQLPAKWINERPLTNQQLAALSHSFIARFMAMVSRTPEQRANAHGYGWDRVLAHAEQGITEDFTVEGDTEFWWFEYGWRGVHPTWTRASYYTIGRADTSGAFELWLNTPIDERKPFIIETDDRRITGEKSTDDGTDFRFWGDPAFNPVRGTYFFSYYGNGRYYYHLETSAAGPMPHYLKAELDMIKAEALIRTGGSKSQIVNLINETRVNRGKLQPLPDNLDYSEYMYYMKYEKDIETGWTYSGRAFFDRRGWGDLVTGTPLHFPVIPVELEVFVEDIYTHGGGLGDSAPKPNIYLGIEYIRTIEMR